MDVYNKNGEYIGDHQVCLSKETLVSTIIEEATEVFSEHFSQQMMDSRLLQICN